MLWVLWDIVLPLIATFLLGLLIGWLLWRWRRSRIDAEGLSKLRRASGRAKADVERLQQSNIELSDRLQAASGASGGELASIRARNDRLTDELKSSRREVAELQATGADGSTDLTSGGIPSADAEDNINRLETELEYARSRIYELENSGQHSDHYAVEYENSNNVVIAEGADLQQEISARDRMIATLEKSLQQFGETGDTTAMMADIALRDKKIDELEALIATLHRN